MGRRLIRGIQAVAKRAGVDICRYRPKRIATLNLLEVLIDAELARTATPFRFLQIGAADGQDNDPLRESILRHRLRGVLVEPLPDRFEALRATYVGVEGLTFLQCAISETDGVRPFYRVRANAPLPPIVQQLASFDRENLTAARQGVPGLDAHIETIAVPTRTIRSVAREHGLESLSLLVVDVEGYDAEVILAALEVGLRPAIIQYESVHLSYDTQTRCLRALTEAGYDFAEVGMDTFCRRTTDGPHPLSLQLDPVVSRANA